MSASPVSTGLGRLLQRVERAAAILHDCYHEAGSLPARGVSIFIEGAIGSLRHAAIEIAWSDGLRLYDMVEGIVRFPSHGVGLRITDAVGGYGVRCRLLPHGGASDQDPEADDEIAAPLRSLACDLVADGELCRLAAGPVFAGLLANGLACHSWMHSGSGLVWSGGAGAARAIAEIASGGRSFPDLTFADLGGVLDQEVVQALRRLGWVRIRSPLPPGFSGSARA